MFSDDAVDEIKKRKKSFKAIKNCRNYPTVFPSTQMFSVCHIVNPALKGNITIRAWTCSGCCAIHDDDPNAVMNLLSEGKRLLALAS